MAAVRHSPISVRQSLVRLGQLGFGDFHLLCPQALRSQFTLRNPLLSDWSLALNNRPDILLHLRGSANLLSAICSLQSSASAADIRAAQRRLVTHFAYELLRAKAPPLYDALPWHDWDFSIVSRFPLWKTRFLLAGDGTTVTMCRCRKSAGVYVLEPNEAIARYVERRAVIEKVRRFRLLSLKPQASSLRLLTEIPLPDNSIDLAIIGSVLSLETGTWKPAIRELLRVAANVLLVENNPLSPPLDDKALADARFQTASVEVRGLGQRRCWWRSSDGA